MAKKLTNKDILVIEEYFLNGFNKSAAFAKYNPVEKYKNQQTFNQAVYQFFNRTTVKEYIDNTIESTIGDRTELINELLYSLKNNIFRKPIDEFYSYSNKQKDIELLIKISGIDKAPKFEPKAQQIEPIIIEVGMLED